MSDFWIKLRGLPYRTTMDDIIKFMSGVEIKGNKRGIYFPISQRNIEWGEAFIELENETAMEAAKAKHNEHMGRRYIEVFASSKIDMETACNSVKGVENVRPKVFQRGRSRSPINDRLAENYVIRMKGLPFSTSKGDIKDFFQGLKILPDGMSILVDQNGKALGDAFVQFATYNDAKLSKERSGNKIGHRYIKVFDSNIEEANAEIRRQMEINDMAANQYEKFPPRSRGSHALEETYTESRRYPSIPFTVNTRNDSIDTYPDDVFRFFRPIVPLSITMRFTGSIMEGEVDVDFATEDDAYNAMRLHRERLGNSHVILSMLPPRGEFSYREPLADPVYDRRERDLLPPPRQYSERESLYPQSRYY